MSFTRFLRLLAAMLLASAALSAVLPTDAAFAGSQTHCGTHCNPPCLNVGCPDGNLWVYGNPSGPCTFWANESQWGACTNDDTLIVNEGVPCSGCDHVNIYYEYNYSGAHACISPGDLWQLDTSNSPVPILFNCCSGQAGYLQYVYHNAASSKWVGSC